MVQTELTGEQRQTATWSEIDWTATEAVVKLAKLPTFTTIIRRWLKAGTVELGTWSPTVAGTPQGGVVTPPTIWQKLHLRAIAAGVRG
jgi:hypothetical protein